MKKAPQHRSRSNRAARVDRANPHQKGGAVSANQRPANSLPPGTHLVAGRRQLEELVRLAPRRIERAYFADDLDSRGQELRLSIGQLGVRIESRSTRDLSALVPIVAHQGVVAIVRDRPEREIRDFLKQPQTQSLVVALDGVEDPHNLGAVMRAAECFGAQAIVWSKNRGSPVTPTVAKSSAGASEILEQFQPANLAEALRRFKEAGYWCVGAALGQQSRSLEGFAWPDKCVVVLGAEGSGLRSLTIELCDFLVQIPMQGQIASLNVAQAASVLLYAWSRRSSAARAD